MKKATWIKIAQVCVTAIPPVAVLLCKFPDFIHDTGKTISAAGILVAIILAMIFKDATRKLFATPSAFKTCIFVFLLSLVAVNLGEQLLIISLTALIAGFCGVPLGIYYNHLVRSEAKEELHDVIKDAINDSKKETDNNEESSETN